MYENNLKYIREYMEMTQKELGKVFMWLNLPIMDGKLAEMLFL